MTVSAQVEQDGSGRTSGVPEGSEEQNYLVASRGSEEGREECLGPPPSPLRTDFDSNSSEVSFDGTLSQRRASQILLR